MENVLHDISWVLPLRSDTATLIFKGFTLLGYTEFFLVMLPIGYWLCGKRMFTRLAVLVGIVGLSNSFLKDLFQDPRPPIEFALDPRVGDSFGFPSGHAQIATAMWLWLAIEIRKPWAFAIAIVIAAGVGFSRLYLGVHDVEDVLGGALLGLATIVIFAGFLRDAAWRDANPAVHLAVVAALVPLVMFLWPKAPAPPAMYALIGFLFFWLFGTTIERATVDTKRHPNWAIAIVAAIAGVAGLFGLMKVAGAGLAAANVSPVLAPALQFSLIALYVTLLAPVLFRLLGLAKSGGEPSAPH